jgi:hypothetical protein
MRARWLAHRASTAFFALAFLAAAAFASIDFISSPFLLALLAEPCGAVRYCNARASIGAAIFSISWALSVWWLV